jgi:predicted dehydrogenase
MITTRREFIKTSAAVAGWSILPSGVWSNSPNSKFCTAHIGINGMGGGDLKSIASHPLTQVVGLADVDARAFNHERIKAYPDAAQFADYREMLETLGDKVDGVVISTPDHTHFPATKMAMEMGKAVYTQKPLTHEIAEAYELDRIAREKNLVTQMGIQCHASTAYRMAVDLLQQGIIGKTSKVYVWSNKKWGDDAPPNTGSDPVPEWLDWNLWLGSAQPRPFLNGTYHPGKWRKILEFGCGTLGDMGVHIMDTPYKALKLGFPRSVKVTCREPNSFSHPTKNTVDLEFPGTEYTADTLAMTWFDGDYAPYFAEKQDNPDLQLEEGKELPKQGAMFIGEDGKRLLLPHLAGPQPLPRDLLGSVTKPDLKAVDHYHQWVDAAMGKGTCSAGFDYAAPFTTGVLLGVVGNRFPGQTLKWDGDNMRFTNNEDANKLVSRSYRTDY